MPGRVANQKLRVNVVAPTKRRENPMPDGDHAAINLRRLAMQLASQLPPDGTLAREVLRYIMELFIDGRGSGLGDARVISLRAAARLPVAGFFGLHLLLNLVA